MSNGKGSLLDAFYNGATTEKKNNDKEYKPVQTSRVVTYSLKEENIRYIELRATHFGSKSAFINHLIEKDMKEHPDIVDMARALAIMK